MLVNRLSTQHNLSSYPEIYNIFYRYLEVPPPSRILTPEAGEDFELALILLYGITRAMGINGPTIH